ncbi:annexin D5-like protein [Cinnamomum micranthum f. kanehirae]|uniref:Annexin n=1 Tax=Cinnamomum micranthum f. kanehirae TaxID=337451 RepID=A0A443N988_9MAGN|nr:annexin D5-like protein [Cinnamomum micranthum f. kanehirae]
MLAIAFVPAAQEQQPLESCHTPQPPQKPQTLQKPLQKAQQHQPPPQQKQSASPTQTQQQPQENKAQTKQQPQQDSISPPKTEAQPQVNHETVAPQKTQPQTQTQAKSIPLVLEKMPGPSGGVVPSTPTPERAILLSLLEESERDATIVWQSLQLMSLDKVALAEVICSRTLSQIRSLKRAYFTYFKSELSKDIVSSTLLINSNTKELLVACLDDKARDEGTNVDVNKAEEDAKQLFKDGENIWGTNNKTFIDIFTKRNRSHLAAVDAAYDKLYGHSLEEAVRKETSRSFKAGLLTLLKCAKNPAKYFAEVLYNSMKGLGTSDTTLIRVVVTRAGIDMEDIKKEFVQAYKTSLKDYIHDDTSGDYRTFLLNLVE